MWNPLRLFSPDAADPAPAEIMDDAGTYTIGDDNVLQAFYGALSMLTASGVKVTQDNAVRCIAVLACLIVRSQTISSLPVRVLEHQGEDDVDIPDDPTFRLLAIAPNDFMTAKEFWRWKQLQEDIRGNAYARIEWNGYTPQAIYPLYGAKPLLIIDRRTRHASYDYSGDDLTPGGPIAPRDLLHFKSAVLRSPFEGTSLIDLASEAIGISIGSEQFFARLLGNGTHFPGYFETDNTLTDEDMTAIEDQLKGHSGLFAAGEMRIFDRGLKYKQNSMSLKDAQIVEQQRWQLQQICSVFRCSMASVQDMTNSTYTNSEQQDVRDGKYMAAPICTDTEAVLRMRLYAGTPQRFAKFNLDGLLRGDYATRASGDATLTGAGILTRQEARKHYDLPSKPGLEKPILQAGFGVVEEDGTITPTNTTQTGAGDQSGAPQPANAAALLAPLVADAVTAIQSRAFSEKDRGKTLAFAVSKLGPIAAAHAVAGIPFDAADFAVSILEGLGDTQATMDAQAASTEEGEPA